MTDSKADKDFESLLSLAKSGDAEAVDGIMQRYKELVKIKARMFFISGADYEDILQEGMIGLFKAIRDYSSIKEASFSTFAQLCITRQIISAVKSANRKKHLPLNSYVPLNPYDSSEDIGLELFSEKVIGPEELILIHEKEDSVFVAINEVLSPFEQDVLVYFLDGKSYDEIAKLSSKDEKSVDNALQRIKHKSQSVLKNLNDA